MRRAISSPAPRLALLAALLAAFAAVVWQERQPPGTYGIDGGYYVHLAQHVAAGDGFVTRVSLYMQGLRSLPQPATVYPLWPVLLGVVAGAVGLDAATAALSLLCAAGALALVFALTNAVARSLGPDGDVLAAPLGVEFTCGHLLVAVLATNPSFFGATLLPMTEPLALALSCAALLALHRAERGPRAVAWAAASGALALAAYLTRFQMAALPVAILATLVLLPGRRARVRSTVAAAAGMAALLAPWLLYLTSSVPRFSVAMLLDFAAHRETPSLPRGPTMRVRGDAWAVVPRSLRSLAEAFVPGTRKSYFAAYGPVAALLPLAAALAVPLVRARRPAPGSDGVVLPVATLLAGAGMLLPLHVSIPLETRHRLPMVFLLALAVATVSALAHRRSGWPARGLQASVVVLCIASITWGIPGVAAEIRHARRLAPTPAERDLAAWLDTLAPAPTVATVTPQRLAVHSRNATFHWIGCHSKPRDVVALLRLLPIDLVVVNERNRSCRHAADLPNDASAVASFGNGPDRVVVFRADAVRRALRGGRERGPEERRRRKAERRRAGERRLQAAARFA